MCRYWENAGSRVSDKKIVLRRCFFHRATGVASLRHVEAILLKDVSRKIFSGASVEFSRDDTVLGFGFHVHFGSSMPRLQSHHRPRRHLKGFISPFASRIKLDQVFHCQIMIWNFWSCSPHLD